mgnify:FL=1
MLSRFHFDISALQRRIIIDTIEIDNGSAQASTVKLNRFKMLMYEMYGDLSVMSEVERL